MEYPALFEPAKEGGFVITFPDFDWGVTQGDNEEDGRIMAEDALELMIHEHIDKGESLPAPSRPRGRKYRLIRLPTLKGMKAELYMVFRASSVKKAELARRLGIPKTNVDRLFDLRKHTRVEQLEAAFAALGKVLAIEVRDTA